MVFWSKSIEFVESSSFDNVSQKSDESIFSHLLKRIHPSTCLSACGAEIDFTFSDAIKSSVTGSELRMVVPDIMAAIDCPDTGMLSTVQRRKRNLALKSLYDLSNQKQNR